MESALSLIGLAAILLLLPALGLVAHLVLRGRRTDEQLRDAQAAHDDLRGQLVVLQQDNAQLSQYRPVLDVAAYLDSLRSEANAHIERCNFDGQQIIQAAQTQATAIHEQATREASGIVAAAKGESERVQEYIAQANVQAQRIIQEAQNYAYASHTQASQNAQALVHGARIEASQAQQYVAQAGAEAERLIQAARDQAAAIERKAQDDAVAIAGSARSEVEQGRQFLSGIQAAAERIKEAAQSEALLINQRAQQRAAAIADEAVRAAEEARQSLARDTDQIAQLQGAITALKNQISGYGTQYVLPSAGFLDELADEYGFDEAGRALKKARETTRSMVKQGSAASCDYVEANRSSTAIAFVIDAFNGKVDTILADLRHDNYGVLQQKVKDAYHLVNQLGAAFRNARISADYLQARLEELRWGATVHEIRMRTREEQRLLKEKIREEERAQREFERARREALKEEETLTKALEKARREMEKSGDAQRAKYEEQIGALTERLRAAEERNQRAMSMAQQTRAGHVYIISNIGSFGEDVFKIGMTRRLEPHDRVRELGDASVPFEFDVHAMISSDDAPALETALHKTFLRNQVNKVNARKEFFRVSVGDIRQEVERLGIAASWTIEAACRQYKETVAIERAMAANQFDVQAWTQSQLREHEKVIREDEMVELEA